MRPVAFDVATRLFVLFFIVLIASAFSVLGAGAPLVTVLCIVTLGVTPPLFIGLQLRGLSFPAEPVSLDAANNTPSS